MKLFAIHPQPREKTDRDREGEREREKERMGLVINIWYFNSVPIKQKHIIFRIFLLVKLHSRGHTHVCVDEIRNAEINFRLFFVRIQFN